MPLPSRVGAVVPSLTAALLVVALSACSDDAPSLSAPLPPEPGDAVPAVDPELVLLVRELAAKRGIGPLEPPRPVRPALVSLGRALTFDRILSGNRDIACSTCHLPSFGTGDGRSLSVGQGATGFGPNRTHSRSLFIPRNAPPLFNVAAMRKLFWDGRVEVDAAGRLRTPAGAAITPEMERVFEFGAISALGMFPVTSAAEMRGVMGNELSGIPDSQPGRIWAALMQRLGKIPAYRDMFERAYPGTRFDRMTFAHASNAIAGFVVDQMTFADSPWDRFLAGNDRALTPSQLDGARAFLELKCSICHAGPTLSDEDFHNVAVAQIGPGQGHGNFGFDDFGRMSVTGNPADRYRFRTSPLRNVELTAPYGHNGAIVSLRDFVAHYSESDVKLRSYDPSQLEPSLRGTVLPNAAAILATRDTLLDGVVFGDEILERLMEYMKALTDPAARTLARVAPARVPSGLPVDRP